MKKETWNKNHINSTAFLSRVVPAQKVWKETRVRRDDRGCASTQRVSMAKQNKLSLELDCQGTLCLFLATMKQWSVLRWMWIHDDCCGGDSGKSSELSHNEGHYDALAFNHSFIQKNALCPAQGVPKWKGHPPCLFLRSCVWWGNGAVSKQQ